VGVRSVLGGGGGGDTGAVRLRHTQKGAKAARHQNPDPGFGVRDALLAGEGQPLGGGEGEGGHEVVRARCEQERDKEGVPEAVLLLKYGNREYSQTH
jgi:hypothetical protein